MKAENLAVRFSAFFPCPKNPGDSDRRVKTRFYRNFIMKFRFSFRPRRRNICSIKPAPKGLPSLFDLAVRFVGALRLFLILSFIIASAEFFC